MILVSHEPVRHTYETLVANVLPNFYIYSDLKVKIEVQDNLLSLDFTSGIAQYLPFLDRWALGHWIHNAT